MCRPVRQPSRSQVAYGRKVAGPRRAALRRALPLLIGDTKASAANRSSRASASNVSTTWGAVAAGAPLPLHALRVGPEEDKAVQERVPIGRLKPIIQCAHEGGGWHRPLIADHHAARQPNVVRPVHAKEHVALRLCDAREIKQAFGAHQTMLEDRSKVARLREVIKLSDTPLHTSDRPADSVLPAPPNFFTAAPSPLSRSIRPRCGGGSRQSRAKFRIRTHESLEREAPAEATWIGKYPRHRTAESRWVSAPLDIRLAGHN